ncbi:MAG: hypothetical protein KJ722_06900 [Candidatus Omnitrophica bacterium]|nr:hypothetical protein [Candidatus Omnitrophota bacterium]MBU2257646.1 hypothetical protein [Candidatus Omnitrophota bacterium]
MKKRSTTSGYWSDRELSARAALAKLTHEAHIVRGSIIRSGRTCGNPSCKCIVKGEKHISSYLAFRYKGKRKMVCIPSHLEDKIKSGVKNYRELMRLLEIISQANFERVHTGVGQKVSSKKEG